MVWQRLKRVFLPVCLSLIMCVALSATAQASTYMPYSDGNIGSSYLQVFRDIVSDLPIDDSYVAFRSGQYTYTLVSGQLKQSGSQFLGMDTSTTVKVYTIDTNSIGYNSRYVYTVTTEQNFLLDASDYLVYSNLGDYPSLEERSTIYAFSTLFIVCVIGCCLLIRPVFGFVLRLRGQ